MSSVSSTEVERLTGFRIDGPSEGQDIYTLFFQTKTVEWVCVADRQILQKLASAIHKNVCDHEQGKS